MSTKQNDAFYEHKMEMLDDAIDGEFVSNCCGAAIYIPDTCSDCKEHCGKEANGINLDEFFKLTKTI